MAKINFNINGGYGPYAVELLNSDIDEFSVADSGAHQIDDVGNGIYTLRITDSNGCVTEQEIIVDPTVSTTTTTSVSKKSIVVGNSQDPTLIFNSVASNRDTRYSGYPTENVVRLFVWFKTLDGKPLENNVVLPYSITAPNIVDTSEFEFVELSDQIHAEVSESIVGPSSTINGSIILKTGFIETYFEYTYYKGDSDQSFTINIGSVTNNIYPSIGIKGDTGNTYGVESVSKNNIIFKY